MTVNQASSSVSTAVIQRRHQHAHLRADPAGQQVYDTATVTGSPFTPTGTRDLLLFNTATPTYGVTTPVSTQTVTLPARQRAHSA